ncbi:hypothetical protein [Candidatus Poriferisodalis sp.]|uniref:hypothetical protein n=1 Tax=Candidatus Poriferisodalis sp. TaxID=3101277 RepID=UPI003AF69360
MSDADTRKVDETSLQDPSKMMVPFAKFKSFQFADKLWVLGGLLFLIVLINIVFSGGGGG